jgi:PilZ domain
MQLKLIAERRLARIRGRARAACERPDYAKPEAYVSGGGARAERACSEQLDAANERRRFNRVCAETTVLVRRIGAFNFDVALKDISAGGCRVEMLEPSVAGDPVIARLPQLEPLGSRVCWAEGTTAGVQFLKTIHPAVFEQLLARLEGEPPRRS